jgi:thiol-disulfide isomerase/thioredoxin
MRRRLLIGMLLVVGGIVAAGLGLRIGRALAPTEAGSVLATSGADMEAEGELPWLAIPVPDVAFTTASGDSASLADYRGRIVLLNFWGSWCPPCLVEIPHLIRVQQALLELGGTIIGPAVDSGSGEEVLRFAAEKGITYPVWLTSYGVAVGRFGAAGYPFTLLIDPNGIIRRQYLGPQTEKVLLRDIGRLITNPPPPPMTTRADAAAGAGAGR